jgi:hypothetical protein
VTDQALRLGIVKVQQTGPDRITRRPSQPRANLARFRRGKDLALQLREAEELSSANRHRVYDALMAEVVEMFEELLGESVVRVEKEQPVQESDALSATVGAVIEPLEKVG